MSEENSDELDAKWFFGQQIDRCADLIEAHDLPGMSVMPMASLIPDRPLHEHLYLFQEAAALRGMFVDLSPPGVDGSCHLLLSRKSELTPDEVEVILRIDIRGL